MTKGAYKKDREGLYTRACSDRTWGNGFKLTESRYQEEFLYCEGCKVLDQVAQRNCGCARPGNVQVE